MPHSSLFLGVGTILSLLTPSISAQTYTYTLKDTYAGSSFYDNFNFFTDSDPTHGFVEYVSQSVATSNKLLGFGSGTAKWGVDTSSVLTNTSIGRQSIRLEGKTSYNHGLFLADIKHMPGAACGIWPAFWTLGDATWPAHGEVDIIEGVNMVRNNQYGAHTADNCKMSFKNQLGAAITPDCAVSTGGATGCAAGSGHLNDYGTDFNSIGGGVYAMQWTSGFIKIWFFPRTSIPDSIKSGSPDVSKFGTPDANFDGASCDIDSHFQNHRMIFDTTFCGDWAGNVYSTSGCPSASEGMNGCINYVANTPGAFTESYWEVNSIKVFSESISSSSSSSSSVVSSSTTSSSTTFATSSRTSSITSKVTTTTSTVPTTSSKAPTTSSTTSAAPTTTSKAPTTTSSKAPTTTSSSTRTPTKSSTTTSKAASKTSSTSSVKITVTTVAKAAATPVTTTAKCPTDNGKIFVSGGKRFLIECSYDRNGGDLKRVYVDGGLAACIKKCADTSGCVDVTLSGTSCYLKSAQNAGSSSSANGARLL